MGKRKLIGKKKKFRKEKRETRERRERRERREKREIYRRVRDSSNVQEKNFAKVVPVGFFFQLPLGPRRALP